MFETLNYVNLEEMSNQFMGMTCDFSDAERLGFELALRNYFNLDNEISVHMYHFYKFCEVHFKRTLVRVRRNGSIIPPAEEMDFYNEVLALLEINSLHSFNETILKIQNKYPKIKKLVKLAFTSTSCSSSFSCSERWLQ
jgi:hypothetical protein